MLASVGIAVTFSTPASAGPLHAIGRDFKTTYHRNKCWPQPFVYPDNASARAPFARMIHNGWQMQNLVASHHFGDDAKLTEAGQRHVRWIVTEAPVRRRTVYVQQAETAHLTEARLAAARNYAQRFATDQQHVDVQPSNSTPRGWPADYVDAINVKFFESTPDPRISGDAGEFQGGQ
ncbi:MAG: hypothetical protein GTN77_09620 [Planctomycetales bacterium]|nr:hypothetical protein [Planctomycetales bacterium]